MLLPWNQERLYHRLWGLTLALLVHILLVWILLWNTRTPVTVPAWTAVSVFQIALIPATKLRNEEAVLKIARRSKPQGALTLRRASAKVLAAEMSPQLKTAEEEIQAPETSAVPELVVPEVAAISGAETGDSDTAPIENGAGETRGSEGLQSLQVQIILTQPWTPTGLNLVHEQKVRISALGVMDYYPGHCHGGCTATPDGSRCTLWDMKVIYLPCWSLMGRIGTNGKPFQVGRSKDLVVTQSGELFLGVNDSYYPDNRGSWVATVETNSALQ